MKKLLNNLKKFLKPKQVLDKPEDLHLYDTDATALFKNKPRLVLIPYTVEEVSKILSEINLYNASLKNPKEKLSFVARGAGTGLSGGAIAAENSVLISLAMLSKLIFVDYENRVALVEAGYVNATLNKALLGTGLHFAPDPSSQLACTIGGNIAENAGGIHCYKYGVTADHVLGMEIVLPNGEIKHIGSLVSELSDIVEPVPDTRSAMPAKCSLKFKNTLSDLDVTGLFIGTEGTFGIVTKALLKLTPNQEAFITIQVSFSSTLTCAEVVSELIRQGFKPAALEIIDNHAVRAVNAAYNLGFSDEVKAVLLIELDGIDEEILKESHRIETLVSDFKPLSYKTTQDLAERLKLWKVRKGSASAFGRIAPFWYLYDAVVPRSKIPAALQGVERIAEKYNLMLANLVHAGDGNLHPNFLYDPEKDTTVIERIFEASHEIMRLCVDLGGTLSGEHGIGVEKQEYMDYLFSPNDMQKMLDLRAIFDPEYISNPDKIFPIKVCKECHREVLVHEL
ncbi:MAG: FAD-binding oxidoreductase [bacterium]